MTKKYESDKAAEEFTKKITNSIFNFKLVLKMPCMPDFQVGLYSVLLLVPWVFAWMFWCMHGIKPLTSYGCMIFLLAEFYIIYREDYEFSYNLEQILYSSCLALVIGFNPAVQMLLVCESSIDYILTAAFSILWVAALTNVVLKLLGIRIRFIEFMNSRNDFKNKLLVKFNSMLKEKEKLNKMELKNKNIN